MTELWQELWYEITRVYNGFQLPWPMQSRMSRDQLKQGTETSVSSYFPLFGVAIKQLVQWVIFR